MVREISPSVFIDLKNLEFIEVQMYEYFEQKYNNLYSRKLPRNVVSDPQCVFWPLLLR